MAILISVFVFATVFLLIFALNLAVTDVFREDQKERVAEEKAILQQKRREKIRSAVKESDLIGAAEAGTSRNPISIVDTIKWLKQICKQAGDNVDPKKILMVCLVFGMVSAFGIYFYSASFLLPSLAILVAIFLPIPIVFALRQKRLDTLSRQLPEVLELMSRVLRSGQTITQAMTAISDEFEEPIGPEFGLCYEQQNLGLSLEVALENLTQRTGLAEMKIFVMGLMIQRQSGGNLAELLEKLSGVMRERQDLKSKVQGFTAEGRLQAGFLVALPFFTYLLMYATNPDYAKKLLEHWDLVFATLGCMGMGLLWIRKIINFDY
ncbi:MAG: type II secretion system F family protein [Pirellulaceae bacterium]|nr:type II secretion system F family protein [Pirellulaceae bacterium]